MRIALLPGFRAQTDSSLRFGEPVGWLLSITLLATALTACAPISSKGAGTDPAGAVDPNWPFAPVEMRFHPFTAVTADAASDATLIEARLTFHDRWGDTTKARGKLRFELALIAASGNADPTRRRRINTWDADIIPLDRNAMHFDGISRTYLFKLRLPQTLPADRPFLLAGQFNSVRGTRLTAETRLTLENP